MLGLHDIPTVFYIVGDDDALTTNCLHIRTNALPVNKTVKSWLPAPYRYHDRTLTLEL